jgi:hypothetical protein
VVVRSDNRPNLPFLTLAVFGVDKGGVNAVERAEPWLFGRLNGDPRR